MQVEFNNTYTDLPGRFYERCEPASFEDPQIIRVNDELARRLGFDPDWLSSVDGARFAVGNHLPAGCEPIATAYAGHQFGNFAHELGDGRAHLLGEVVDEEGQRYDIQLKGSGRTPFSRRGDGRAPLGPVLREYLVSEAMHALGIPTTRSLAAAATGEQVQRDGENVPGAVLVRVARSHIRVGTFQYFAARNDREAVRKLTTYALDRHDPGLDRTSPVDLFEAVARRQARLVAQWQNIGFIHGVMNTDNMLISGETIDYGPCAFMNEYDPGTVYSSIDRRGRYAYDQQPDIARWNLNRFAGALLMGFDDESTMKSRMRSILEQFPDRLEKEREEELRRKIGLDANRDGDASLCSDLLNLMERHEVDFTLTFRRLTELADPGDETDCPQVGEFFTLPGAFDDWFERWRDRLTKRDEPAADIAAGMRSVNPVVIPRNYQVNAAIDDAVQRGDFEAFHTLADVFSDPFEFPDDNERLVHPPSPEERVEATFCGT